MTCSDRNVKSIFLAVAEMTSFFNLGWKNLKIWQNLGRSKDFGETCWGQSRLTGSLDARLPFRRMRMFNRK